MVKNLIKGALILLAGIFLGTVLLWVSYLLPVSEESVHVAESVLILEQEGWYPTVPLMRQYENTDLPQDINPGGILDNFTDSIMITTAGHRPDNGALYQAMNMTANGEEIGYSYYWHGYVVLLRPLLLFLNYADIRVLNQLLQILLTFILAGLLYRRKGTPWAALGLTVYGLLLPMSLAQSLQYSWVFYIGILGSLSIVRFREWFAEKQRIYFLFLILGMLTSYMDLLTYPLFTWGIPMIWWIVTENREEANDRKQLVAVILCGVAWICGYGGLWMGKWLIGGLVLHRSIWSQAWNEVRYRAGVLPDTTGYDISHWEVIKRNLYVFQSIQSVVLLGLWILWGGSRILRKRVNRFADKTLALLLIALSPIVWYIVLHNHTFVHSSYTYRIWVIGLTALLAIMINSLDETAARQYGLGKRVLPALMVLVAVTVSLNIKEQSFVHNGNYVPTQLELRENTQFLQTFTPSYNYVSSISILLYADPGQEGEVEIGLWNEDRLIWESVVPAAELTEDHFYEFPADLHLNKKTSYQISITGRDLDEGRIAVGITGLGLYPLPELPQLLVGDQTYDSQLICGFHYLHLARTRILVLAVELQLLLYWSIYLLWEKIPRKRLADKIAKQVKGNLSNVSNEADTD